MRRVITAVIVCLLLAVRLYDPAPAYASKDAGLARLDRLGYILGGAALVGLGVIVVVLVVNSAKDRAPAAKDPDSNRVPAENNGDRRGKPDPRARTVSHIAVERVEPGTHVATVAVRIQF